MHQLSNTNRRGIRFQDVNPKTTYIRTQTFTLRKFVPMVVVLERHSSTGRQTGK